MMANIFTPHQECSRNKSQARGIQQKSQVTMRGAGFTTRRLQQERHLSLILVAVAVSFLITTSGCGKKETPPPLQAPEEISQTTEVLPELEQNKLYLKNAIVAGPQDTSFEPVANEMEEVPEGEQGPLLD